MCSKSMRINELVPLKACRPVYVMFLDIEELPLHLAENSAGGIDGKVPAPEVDNQIDPYDSL